MNARRAVLLDLDGTIADPCEGFVRCARHALERLRIVCPPDSELARHIGPPLHRTLAMLTNRTDAAEAVRFFRERYTSIGILENAVYPGIPGMLRELHASGFRLFVATSKPTIFARRIIDHFRLGEFFEGIYGSELDGTRGDKAEVIAALLEAEGISPTAAVMVGDRSDDIRGARANDLSSIGALWGYGTRGELEEAGAAVLCEAPSDLLGLLAIESWPAALSPFQA